MDDAAIVRLTEDLDKASRSLLLVHKTLTRANRTWHCMRGEQLKIQGSAEGRPYLIRSTELLPAPSRKRQQDRLRLQTITTGLL